MLVRPHQHLPALRPRKGQVLILIAVLSVVVALFSILLINVGFLRTSADAIVLGAMRNAALSGLQHTDPCHGFNWYYVKVERQPTRDCDRGSSADGPDTQLPTGAQVVRDLLIRNLDASSHLFEGGYRIDVEVINYSPDPETSPDVSYMYDSDGFEYPNPVSRDGSRVISNLAGGSYDRTIIAVRLRVNIVQLNTPAVPLDQITVVQANDR